MRTGLIAKKLGMSRIFETDGTHVPVTVLAVDGLEVVDVRTQERDGKRPAPPPFSWVPAASRPKMFLNR